MAKIISDNRKVEKILQKMARIIVRNGGFIDDAVEIRCAVGDVSVHSPENRDERQIFKIPHALLLPFEEFEIEIKKDKFVLTSASPAVSKVQKELMKAMLDFYNATGKLHKHRETSPWLVFKDAPQVIDIFLKCRFGEEFQQMRAMLDEGDDGAFEVLTFFKTRLLACRLHKGWGRQASVVLPLLDALNHHVLGAGFDHIYTKENATLSIQCAQQQGSDECYASYGKMDAMDTYLHYGFVDGSAPFVRSIPIVVDLGKGGKVHIESSYGKVGAEELPEALRDLVFFMPAVSVDHQSRQIQLSHLLIPEEKGVLSLRRVLDYVIRVLDPEVEQADVKAQILKIEKAILVTNIKLYDDIERVMSGIEDARKKSDVLDFVALQKSKINSYVSAINKLYQ